jgi:hypothetical protein
MTGSHVSRSGVWVHAVPTGRERPLAVLRVIPQRVGPPQPPAS